MEMLIVGCGYVGQAVAKLWKEAGHHVRVTTRSQEKVKQLQRCADQVYVLEPDYEAALKEALKGIDVLLIAVAPDTRDAYEEAYLDTAKLIGSLLPDKVRQVIYTGSCSVYGEHRGQWVDEETLPAPLNNNTAILLETEEILLEQQTEKRNICILRLGEIIGPGREVRDKLRRMNGKTMPGTGLHHANLSHLTDIMRAIDFAAKKDLNGVYNVCADVHPARRDLYNSLCLKEGIEAISWDPEQTNIHRGDKKISSEKIKSEHFQFTGKYP